MMANNEWTFPDPVETWQPAVADYAGIVYSSFRLSLALDLFPSLVGTPGPDILVDVSGRHNVIDALAGDDQIMLADGVTDYVMAGEGNDTVSVRPGPLTQAHIDAGPGDDTIRVEYEVPPIDIDGGTGWDRVLFVSNYYPYSVSRAGAELLFKTSYGTTTVRNVESVSFEGFTDVSPNRINNGPSAGTDIQYGSDSAELLEGGGGDDFLRGFGGNDTLDGGTGDDALYGGLGTNLLRGGEGDDTYHLYNGADQVVEAGGEGNDTVVAYGGIYSYTLPANIENLLGGRSASRDPMASSPIEGYGNALDNRIEGGFWGDRLYGLGGNDYLVGGGGSDSLYGGEGDDTYFLPDSNHSVFEDPNAGRDLVLVASSRYTLAANVEDARAYDTGGLGWSSVILVGNDLANVLTGSNGGDALYGGKGDDRLVPLADTQGGYSQVDGGEGIDTLVVLGPMASYVRKFEGTQLRLQNGERAENVLAANIEFVQFSDGTLAIGDITERFDPTPGNDQLTGTSGDDSIDALAGNDTVRGLAGNDRLVGGAGNDSLDGGAGTDSAVFTGPRNAYRVEKHGAQWIVTDRRGNDGRDTLTSIETLEFAGGKQLSLVAPPPPDLPAYGQDAGFLFDPVYYQLHHPDVGVPTVSSYFGTGAKAGYRPNAWFDANYYAARWPDLQVLQRDPALLYQHFNLFGVFEGRSPGPMFDRFDGDRYLADNPDVAAYVEARMSDFLGYRVNGAIAHFIIYGAAEGRVMVDLMGQPINLDYTVDLG